LNEFISSSNSDTVAVDKATSNPSLGMGFRWGIVNPILPSITRIMVFFIPRKRTRLVLSFYFREERNLEIFMLISSS
jgi:hypothetical protein